MIGQAARRSTPRTSPQGIFDQTIHDNCERRGHFENGEFVYEFGSEGRGQGLLPVPAGLPRSSDEGQLRRHAVEQPPQLVRAGRHALHRMLRGQRRNDPGHNWVEVNTPFYKRHRDLRIGDWMVQPGTIALVITGVVAGALVVHGFGMKITGRMDGGADFEKVRGWDAKHPDKSIGKYDLTRDEAKAACEKSSHNATRRLSNPMKKKGGQA